MSEVKDPFDIRSQKVDFLTKQLHYLYYPFKGYLKFHSVPRGTSIQIQEDWY